MGESKFQQRKAPYTHELPRGQGFRVQGFRGLGVQGFRV